jgi:hypothetical protein
MGKDIRYQVFHIWCNKSNNITSINVFSEEIFISVSSYLQNPGCNSCIEILFENMEEEINIV